MRFVSTVRAAIILMVLFSLASTARAAGEPRKFFPGLYAGMLAGYAFTDDSWSQREAVPLPGANFDLDGGLAGLTVGNNWHFGNFLLGLEADATTLALGDSQSCGLMGATCTVDLDALATVRGRAGYLFGSDSQFMVYATGGLAVVWADFTSPAPGAGSNFTEATYAVGGGFEGYVFDNDWISTKLEYLFVGLNETKSYTVGLNPTVTATLKLNGMHVLRWGWNIHF